MTKTAKKPKGTAAEKPERPRAAAAVLDGPVRGYRADDLVLSPTGVTIVDDNGVPLTIAPGSLIVEGPALDVDIDPLVDQVLAGAATADAIGTRAPAGLALLVDAAVATARRPEK